MENSPFGKMVYMCFPLLFLCLLPAPSRPPKIISKRLKGKSVNITWEHVVPLANEASTNGYKVSRVQHLLQCGL